MQKLSIVFVDMQLLHAGGCDRPLLQWVIKAPPPVGITGPTSSWYCTQLPLQTILAQLPFLVK